MISGADIAKRAMSVYGKKWRYALGGKPDPGKVPPGARDIAADCTGFVWWATGRRQVGRLAGNPLWRSADRPVVGAAVWHDARPPAKFGHAGIIIAVYPDGDFDSLDCSSTPPGPRGGAIRLVRRARAFWSKNGTASFGYWVPRYMGSPGYSTAGALALAALVAAVVWWAGQRQT